MLYFDYFVLLFEDSNQNLHLDSIFPICSYSLGIFLFFPVYFRCYALFSRLEHCDLDSIYSRPI